MDADHPSPPSGPSKRPRIGLAIASLVFGLLAVFGSVVLVGALAGGLGILLGVIHIAKRRGPNGMAWAGILLALIGVGLSGGFGFLYFKGFQLVQNQWSETTVQTVQVTSTDHDTSPEFRAWIGREAPDITLTSLDGETFTLSELRGRRVVLDFWATWCSPCRREIPHFIQLTTEYPREELLIIGISDETEEELREFVVENGMTYPIVSAQDLPSPFDAVVAIPTTFFIDRNGVIQKVLVGYHDYESLERAAITEDDSADPEAGDAGS